MDQKRWITRCQFLMIALSFCRCTMGVEHNNDLFSLLKTKNSGVSVPVVLKPKPLVLSILQDFITQEQNVEYVAAIKILADHAVTQSYEQFLNSIKLDFIQFFLESLHQAKMSVQQTKLSLFQLLKVPAVQSTSSVRSKPSYDLFDMLHHNSTITPVKKEDLFQLMQSDALEVPEQQIKSKSDISLMDQNESAVQPMPEKDRIHNLMSLLSLQDKK